MDNLAEIDPSLIYQASLLPALEAQFDTIYYEFEYPDLGPTDGGLFFHFMRAGWFEGRNPNPYFDTVSYLIHNPDVAAAGINPLVHYLLYGLQEGRIINASVSPSVRSLICFGRAITNWVALLRPEIDGQFYLDKLETGGTIPSRGFDPVAHYAYRGWREGLDPRVDVKTSALIEKYPHSARLLVNPLLIHVEERAKRTGDPRSTAVMAISIRNEALEDGVATLVEGVPSASTGECHVATLPCADLSAKEATRREFDERYYLTNNPDVAEARVDAFEHFLYTGWREGRNPTLYFDVSFYTRTYGDILGEETNPFLHFVTYGRAAGMSPGASTVHSEKDVANLNIVRSGFEPVYYLGEYPDVAAAGVEPVEHYYYTGWQEGRNPCREFDTAYYLRANMDVKDAGINPFLHYLTQGKSEGRLPCRPGGYRRQIIEDARDPQRRAENYVIEKSARLKPPALSRHLRAALESRSGLVVSLSHDCYVSVVGGTQIFIADEQRLFEQRGYSYLHLSPRRPGLSLADDNPKFEVQVVLNGDLIGTIRLRTVESLLKKCVGEKRFPRMLIVHSTFGFDTTSICSLHSAIAPQHSLYWVHDYSSICEGYNLLRNDVEYCHGPAPTSLVCRICVYGAGRQKHLARMRELFQHCSFRVVAPSESALNLWRDRSDLPFISAHSLPHWQLVPVPLKGKTPVNRPKRIRVAYIGFCSANKGWQIFSDLVLRFSGDARLEFFHFAADKAINLPGLQFVYMRVAPDDRSAATRLLRKYRIDFLVILSPWPETFSFVAHEGISAGCSLLCFRDSGNVAALVQSTGRGLVFEDVASLTDFLASPELTECAERARTNRMSHRVLETGTSAQLDSIVEWQPA